jgi:hypothetical protein
MASSEDFIIALGGTRMELQESEIEALQNSALFVKYAAESSKKLSDEILVPITAAWKSQQRAPRRRLAQSL